MRDGKERMVSMTTRHDVVKTYVEMDDDWHDKIAKPVTVQQKQATKPAAQQSQAKAPASKPAPSK